MRTLAILSVFFLGFGTFSVLQNSLVLGQPGGGGGRGGGQWQQGGGQPGGQAAGQQPGGGQQGGGQRPGMQPGQQPVAGQGNQPVRPGQQPAAGQGNQPVRPGQQPAAGQGNQPVRPGQPAAGQANQQVRPAQPTQPAAGAMNANQVTQAIARLRAMDANGNGTLEANEIPANQRERVNTIITQLGGNPNAAQFNIANLERRALNNAQQPGAQQPGNEQQRQQQSEQGGRQQRQQTPQPLVRPFGETRPAETPVSGFGQAPAQQTAQTARGQQQQQQGRQQRDAAALANQQAVQAARAANTARQTTVYDSIPATLRANQTFSWFFEFDTDRDGQLTMLEFVNGSGGTWTADIAGEFLFLDRNGDGFVTVEEALMSIQEDDEKRAREAREQEAIAGPPVRGQQPERLDRSAAGRPTPPGGAAPATGNPRTPAANNQGGNTARPTPANQNAAPARGQPNQPPAGPAGRGNMGGRRGG